jgi:hypothetical protein
MPKWSEVPWGTVVTGVVAIYGAVLGTVNLFAQRSRDRQTAKEAQRKQAEQVIAWLVPDDGPEEPGRLFYGLALQNNSGRLVYEVIASIVMVRPGIGVQTRASEPQREDRPPMQFRSFVSQLPPGQTKTRIENPGQGMLAGHGIELAFQDAAGAYWLRLADGTLKQVEQSPHRLYNLLTSDLPPNLPPT